MPGWTTTRPLVKTRKTGGDSRSLVMRELKGHKSKLVNIQYKEDPQGHCMQILPLDKWRNGRSQGDQGNTVHGGSSRTRTQVSLFSFQGSYLSKGWGGARIRLLKFSPIVVINKIENLASAWWAVAHQDQHSVKLFLCFISCQSSLVR
jgi:hypothetical protein